jgi:hypothetical protein
MLTGNNISLAGDMPRRILISRIDPNSEKPFEREFDFDPVVYCSNNRLALIAATLTLLRHYITTCKASPGKGQVGSFEMWDKWVRQPIVYINQTLALGEYGDVLDQLRSNQVADPEQETWSEFLRAWYEVFQDKKIMASQLVAYYKKYSDKNSDDPLVEAIESTRVGKGQLTAKALGRRLGFRLGRIAGGLRLEKGLSQDNTSTWRVVKIEKSEVAQTGFAGFEGSVSTSSKLINHINPGVKELINSADDTESPDTAGFSSAQIAHKTGQAPTKVLIKPNSSKFKLPKTNPANPSNPVLSEDNEGEYSGLL